MFPLQEEKVTEEENHVFSVFFLPTIYEVDNDHQSFCWLNLHFHLPPSGFFEKFSPLHAVLVELPLCVPT